jgi:Zn-dependent metalloprotease
MVEAIKMRGDDSQREMAAQMEVQSLVVNAQREEASATIPEPAPNVFESPFETGSKPTPKREVYDGVFRSTLPGVLVRSEGQDATGDVAVDDAYDGGGAVFNLYLDNYGRDSLDGNGAKIVQTVHHRSKYNNAFWNGKQMAYGDGDGELFRKFTELSVIGHELSHGVVQYSGGLVYRDQSGALNESFADVFGSLTMQYMLGQSACEASWLVGEGILGPNIKGVALRSMKAPGTAYDDTVLGKDPQPYHMADYVNTAFDNGGVHINSGIPNQAFYLLAQYLGGNAWEKAGTIWYKTMQKINNPMATFADWADKTVEVAFDEYGTGSKAVLFTRRAWKLVGINV